MRLIGIPGEHATVPCATCNHHWSVDHLLNEIGRHRLRAEGFATIVFDDGAIMVNWCPHCELPAAGPMPAALAMQESPAAA